MCQPPAGGCFLHCHTTVCSADEALETTVSSDPGLRDQLAVPGLRLGFPRLLPKELPRCGGHLSLLLVSAGTHGPAWVQVSGPLQQRRHVSANTEQNLRDGVATRDACPGLCPPPAFSPFLRLHVRTALSAAHTFISTHPGAPAWPSPPLTLYPTVRAELGGPLCVYPTSTARLLSLSYCCPFTCLYPLLDVSSLRTGGLSALWGRGPST